MRRWLGWLKHVLIGVSSADRPIFTDWPLLLDLLGAGDRRMDFRYLDATRPYLIRKKAKQPINLAQIDSCLTLERIMQSV